jgi:hypothetical protein
MKCKSRDNADEAVYCLWPPNHGDLCFESYSEHKCMLAVLLCVVYVCSGIAVFRSPIAGVIICLHHSYFHPFLCYLFIPVYTSNWNSHAKVSYALLSELRSYMSSPTELLLYYYYYCTLTSHNERINKVCIVHYLSSKIKVIESIKMRLAGHGARMREMRTVYRLLVGKQQERDR